MPSPNTPITLNINPDWEVHPTQVKEWLDKKRDMLLLDVRQLREWNICRIEGAQLIPLPQLESDAATIADWKDRPIVVYCHHGVRSLKGTAILRHLGFKTVHSMAGGIEAWSLLADQSVLRY